MNCYIINLDRSVDRWKFMQKQFEFFKEKDNNIDFERIAAVDSKVLSDSTLNKYYDKNYFCFNAVYFPNIVQSGGLSKGEIACFLSHRKCWQRVLEGTDEYAAIFEDDVIFSEYAIHYLGTTDWIPKNSDIVKLEVMTHKLVVDKKPTKEFYNRIITRFYSTNIGAAGYIISKTAARSLLEMTEHFFIPVDHVMFGHLFPYFWKLICYQVIPAICIQDKELNNKENIFKSTLSERDQKINTKKIGICIKIKREFIRLFYQIKMGLYTKKKIFNTFNEKERLKI